MVFKNFYLILFFYFFSVPFFALQAQSKVKYEVVKIPFFKPDYLFGEVILEMDYASSKIKNPEEWDISNNGKIKAINIIYSDYPKIKDKWITHYDTLLNRRIRSLQTLIPNIHELSDSSVFTDKPKVKWTLTLETNCETEKEAKALFHGIVITYKKKVPVHVIKNYKVITKIIEQDLDFKDSVVYNVFERNNQWYNMLIINDWTASMYTYGAQVLLWHRLNPSDDKIKNLLLFNDGNHKKDENKDMGETGGFTFLEAYNFKEIYKAVRFTMLNGRGGDIPENDVEAILYGIEKSNNAIKDVILIADNSSGIRDKILITKITKPIKIIICGKDKSAIHPDYLELAYKTKGSIHTIEEDIVDLVGLFEGEKLTIGQYTYSLKDGEFEVIEE